jgi:hypothetical protein
MLSCPTTTLLGAQGRDACPHESHKENQLDNRERQGLKQNSQSGENDPRAHATLAPEAQARGGAAYLIGSTQPP